MTTPHVLLVEGDQGETIALRFASASAARDWEDAHPAVQAVGCVPLVTQAQAILNHGATV